MAFNSFMEAKSAYDIDYEALNSMGIKGLIFDIDNTLVPHDAPFNDKSDELMRRLYDMGFKIFILSNNDDERVQKFIKNVKIDYIPKSGKPGKKNYLKAMEKMGTGIDETVAIGDQLLTDWYGAKNAGIKFIRVGLVNKKEPPHIRLKRILEKILGWKEIN